jgi:hypothetical protein
MVYRLYGDIFVCSDCEKRCGIFFWYYKGGYAKKTEF